MSWTVDTFGFKVTSRWLWLDIRYALIPAPPASVCGDGGIERVSLQTGDSCSPCVK